MLPWTDGDTVRGMLPAGPRGHSGPGPPSRPEAYGHPTPRGPPQPPGRGREACLAGPPPSPRATKAPAPSQEGRPLGQQRSIEAVNLTGDWPSQTCADPRWKPESSNVAS